MNQKIKTSLGTTVLIIIAFTAGLFIWHYEINQRGNETQVSQPLRKDTVAPDNKFANIKSSHGEIVRLPGEAQPDIIGGQCDYNSIAGTCKILSITQNNDVKLVFTSTGSLPETPLAKNLNGKHAESLGIFNEQAISLKRVMK